VLDLGVEFKGGGEDRQHKKLLWDYDAIFVARAARGATASPRRGGKNIHSDRLALVGVFGTPTRWQTRDRAGRGNPQWTAASSSAWAEDVEGDRALGLRDEGSLEKEDAQRGFDLNISFQEFEHEEGQRHDFEKVRRCAKTRQRLVPREPTSARVRHVLIGVGRNASLYGARLWHRVRQARRPVSRQNDAVHAKNISSGRLGLRRRNIIGRWRTRAASRRQLLTARMHERRRDRQSVQQKMPSRLSYDNQIAPDAR